jgi:hypothetical protein
MLTGKKTYITAGLLALATFAWSLGFIDKSQYDMIMGLAGALGLAALRAGVAKE